jgi:hypothetical protein
VRLLAQIASHFGVVVTQTLAAQAVSVIGALGGAAVNYAFMEPEAPPFRTPSADDIEPSRRLNIMRPTLLS